MDDIAVSAHRTPRFTVQYEMTEELARQTGADLWESRLTRFKTKYPDWGTTKPLLLLGLTALQILLAMAAVIWVSDGIDTIATVLLVLCGIVLVLLLYKASFYAMPFLGRWVAGRQLVRLVRSMDHSRIEWRLYEDRLETESAATQRRVPWPDVAWISQTGQSILLQLHDGLPLMIPSTVLGEEARLFLEKRVPAQPPAASLQ